MVESVDSQVGMIKLQVAATGNSREVNTAVPGRSAVKADAPTLSEISEEEIQRAAFEISKVVSQVAETSLSFSIEEELSRTVVSVRAVGSDEVIRQFPPDEFLTVAKFIADQEPDALSEDFLKGILFDQYT